MNLKIAPLWHLAENERIEIRVASERLLDCNSPAVKTQTECLSLSGLQVK